MSARSLRSRNVAGSRTQPCSRKHTSNERLANSTSDSQARPRPLSKFHTSSFGTTQKYESSKDHNRWTLMKERSLFIQKFEQIAREDPRALSAFLGGSLADGTEDDFSDIDIYYILEEQSYSDFTSQMRDLLDKMGPLVYLEQHNNFAFDLILFIFHNGVKGGLVRATTTK